MVTTAPGKPSNDNEVPASELNESFDSDEMRLNSPSPSDKEDQLDDSDSSIETYTLDETLHWSNSCQSALW